jgi:hypothetical protein
MNTILVVPMFTEYTKASYCRMIHGRSGKYDGAEAVYIILGVRRSDGFAAGGRN